VLAIAFGDRPAKAMQSLASRGAPTILLMGDEENPCSLDEAARPAARCLRTEINAALPEDRLNFLQHFFGLHRSSSAWTKKIQDLNDRFAFSDSTHACIKIRRRVWFSVSMSRTVAMIFQFLESSRLQRGRSEFDLQPFRNGSCDTLCQRLGTMK